MADKGFPRGAHLPSVPLTSDPTWNRLHYKNKFSIEFNEEAVADQGGPRRPCSPPPGPVKISHKKDGCRR